MARVLKTLCVFLFLPVILFGCDNPGKSSVVTDFSADFTAKYNGLDLSGKISADRRGLLTLELDSPETLDDVIISYKNSQAELKRGGLICTADEAYLPQNSFPSLLKSALEGLRDSVVNKGVYPKNGRLAVDNNGRRFEFFTDENGLISRITLDGEVDVVFSDVEITE